MPKLENVVPVFANVNDVHRKTLFANCESTHTHVI